MAKPKQKKSNLEIIAKSDLKPFTKGRLMREEIKGKPSEETKRHKSTQRNKTIRTSIIAEKLGNSITGSMNAYAGMAGGGIGSSNSGNSQEEINRDDLNGTKDSGTNYSPSAIRRI